MKLFLDDLYRVRVTGNGTDSEEIIVLAGSAFEAVFQAEKRLKRLRRDTLILPSRTINVELIAILKDVESKEK